jgi:uncharacterized protein YbjT (DUF2867 family)
VELAVGDLEDPASVRAALAGVDRVFLCVPNLPHQLALETTVIDAACDAGVRRMVKMGALGSRVGAPVAFWDTHARIEDHLRASGLPAVVLRLSYYATNPLGSAPAVGATGCLFMPAADATVAAVDPRDVAAVAAAVLGQDGHEGRAYTVTGPEAVTRVRWRRGCRWCWAAGSTTWTSPDDAARGAMREAGLPPWMADQIVAVWGELRQGVASSPTDLVRVLTGPEPRTVTDFLRDHADAFRG